MKLLYVVQNVAMGTGHALFQARKIAKGRFLVGYCDVIVEPGLWKKLSGVKGKDAVAALRREEHPERFGVALVSGKKLEAIVEKPAENLKSNLVNVVAYLFSEKIFPALEKIKMSSRNEFELTDAINALAAIGKAGFVVYKGKCLDIGTIEDLKGAG
jgi:glucose-1-phosphate thymidylyltransferase